MFSARVISRLRNIVCLGAHSDDIEIGCGGTILRFTRMNPDLHVRWVVFSADPLRAREARNAAALFLRRAGSAHVEVLDFRDGHFPSQTSAIKTKFEQLKSDIEPDLIFTHFGQDHHQDHRTLSSLAWNTWRNHLILEYEIPKYDGDLGHPNAFVPLSRKTCQRKARLLARGFPSQATRQWFDEIGFLALPRIRGIECASPTGFAEGFHCRKLMIDAIAARRPKAASATIGLSNDGVGRVDQR